MIDLVLKQLKERRKQHEEEYKMYVDLPAARLNVSIRIDELQEIEKIVRAVQDVEKDEIPEATPEQKEAYLGAFRRHTMRRFEKGV